MKFKILKWYYVINGLFIKKKLIMEVWCLKYKILFLVLKSFDVVIV